MLHTLLIWSSLISSPELYLVKSTHCGSPRVVYCYFIYLSILRPCVYLSPHSQTHQSMFSPQGVNSSFTLIRTPVKLHYRIFCRIPMRYFNTICCTNIHNLPVLWHIPTFSRGLGWCDISRFLILSDSPSVLNKYTTCAVHSGTRGTYSCETEIHNFFVKYRIFKRFKGSNTENSVRIRQYISVLFLILLN
jgi:hypothetical protein